MSLFEILKTFEHANGIISLCAVRKGSCRHTLMGWRSCQNLYMSTALALDQWDMLVTQAMGNNLGAWWQTYDVIHMQ